MAKTVVILLLVAVAGYTAAAGLSSPAESAPARARVTGSSFKFRGTVTRVVDGDTILVRIGKKSERVRLIGIDAPELGQCFSTEATVALRHLVLAKQVILSGDRTQPRRDVYQRLLAYVDLPSGIDVGRTLLQQGHAILYETEPPFARYAAYDGAASAARDARAGLNGACAEPLPPTPTTTSTTTTSTTPLPSPPPPAANCAASYPDVCIPPPPPDLDCGQIPYKRFRVVYTVPNPDPHRFDGDRDGIGCET